MNTQNQNATLNILDEDLDTLVAMDGGCAICVLIPFLYTTSFM
jgi:hypothetical protein